jgi:hypothetical protein
VGRIQTVRRKLGQLQRRLLVPLIIGATVSGLTFLAPPVASAATRSASLGPGQTLLPAAVNPNPIRWTVFKTLYGKHGEDIPLRYGQHDAGPIDGFGTRHIEDGHELWGGDWTDTANMIEHVIQSGACTTSGTKVTCRISGAYSFTVVYATHVDPRSGDGRPFGVITFYWSCNTCVSTP